MFSEAVAAFGLLLTIFGCIRHRPAVVPFAVAAYIVVAYWFTALILFANPAVIRNASRQARGQKAQPRA